jgi:hypothetical protein
MQGEGKMQARPAEGEYTQEYNKEYYLHRPFGMEFPSCGLLTVKEKAQIFSLEFPCRYCTRQSSGTLLSCTMSNWGCSPRFSKKRSSRTVARCESADWDTFMVHA